MDLEFLEGVSVSWKTVKGTDKGLSSKFPLKSKKGSVKI